MKEKLTDSSRGTLQMNCAPLIFPGHPKEAYVDVKHGPLRKRVAFFFFFVARPSLDIHLWEKGHLKVSETISNLLASGFDSGRAHRYAFLARSTNSQHFFVCPCCTRNVGTHDHVGLLS